MRAGAGIEGWMLISGRWATARMLVQAARNLSRADLELLLRTQGAKTFAGYEPRLQMMQVCVGEARAEGAPQGCVCSLQRS